MINKSFAKRYFNKFSITQHNKKHVHWQGSLSWKKFFLYYWKLVWIDNNTFGKIIFSIFVSHVFFLSIIFQFIFKKFYCSCHDHFHPNQQKDNLILDPIFDELKKLEESEH